MLVCRIVPFVLLLVTSLTNAEVHVAGDENSPHIEGRHTDYYGDLLPPDAVLRLGTIRFRHEGEACSIAFSSDQKFLASACRDGLILLWKTFNR